MPAPISTIVAKAASRESASPSITLQKLNERAPHDRHPASELLPIGNVASEIIAQPFHTEA